ncbi:MAG: hypothetical protein ACRCYW_15565, partial [Aeromonas sp.]|uniref:hypothetical protein n=1 Tax=Aeromonas sp. TaxID=647 RepID=UPI003F36C8C9
MDNPEAIIVSHAMADALFNVAGTDPVISTLLARHPPIRSRGPELLHSILDSFLPTDLGHYPDRLLGFHSTAQGHQEYPTQYL